MLRLNSTAVPKSSWTSTYGTHDAAVREAEPEGPRFCGRAEYARELRAGTRRTDGRGRAPHAAPRRDGRLRARIRDAQRQLDEVSRSLTGAAAGDAVLWIAYPKRTSKTYPCEFNRDSGWTVLGAAGYEPVRQVAIDADWSALRFRKAEFIRTMTRNPAGAISKAGRAKTRTWGL